MPVEYSDLDPLKSQHNDIRFEQMQQAAEIVKESLKGDATTSIKSTSIIEFC